MPIQFYIIISFFTTLFTIAALARNSTLETLPVYPVGKILFEEKNSHVLRHVIIYDYYKKQFDLRFPPKKGYLTFGLKKSQLQLGNESKNDVVKFALPASSQTNGQYLQCPTNHINQYRGLLITNAFSIGTSINSDIISSYENDLCKICSF